MNQAIRKNLPKDWVVSVADGEKSLSNTLTSELIKVEDRLRRSCRNAVIKKRQPLAIIFTFQNGKIKPPIKRIKHKRKDNIPRRLSEEFIFEFNTMQIQHSTSPSVPFPPPIQSSPSIQSLPRVASPEYVQPPSPVLLPPDVVSFAHTTPPARVQLPPPVLSSQRFTLQQIDNDRLLYIVTTSDGSSLNEGYICVNSRHPTTENLASLEMNDKPDWLIDFEKRKEERLKEYDEKNQ